MKKLLIVAAMVAITLAPLQLAGVGGTQYCSTRCAGSVCWTECTTTAPIRSSDVMAAELTQNEPDRTRGWQDREYFGRAYAEKELAGGDGPTSGEAAAEGASAGATGGNGDGCGPK